MYRKDVRLPVQLQRAMAAEAEAAREARAKVRIEAAREARAKVRTGATRNDIAKVRVEVAKEARPR
jgi:hypothetical protein